MKECGEEGGRVRHALGFEKVSDQLMRSARSRIVEKSGVSTCSIVEEKA